MRHLLERRRLFHYGYPKVRRLLEQRLFEARYLLEEIQYIRLETYGLNFSVLKQIIKKTRNMEKTITRNNKCEEANYVTQDILYEINFVF